MFTVWGYNEQSLAKVKQQLPSQVNLYFRVPASGTGGALGGQATVSAIFLVIATKQQQGGKCS